MKARVRWFSEEKAWVIELWDAYENDWVLSKMWYTNDDRVHDSIICEIANLTELGYEIEYRNTNYTNGGNV